MKQSRNGIIPERAQNQLGGESTIILVLQIMHQVAFFLLNYCPSI